MRSHDLLRSAATSLTTNVSRSLLTALGIIIGVGSVVLMLSIGQSFQNYILNLIESIGTNTIDIFPVGLERFGGNKEALTEEDYNAVRRLPTVTRVTPVIIVPKTVKYGREETSPILFGALDVIFENYGIPVERGRLLDVSDEQGAKQTAVIGSKVVEDLFGIEDPLGQRITVGETTFTVIGILKKQGSLLGQNLDSLVVIPFSTARMITGQRYLTFMNLKSVGDPSNAIEDIKTLLRKRHRITNPTDDPDKDDFVARSAEQVTTIVNSVTLGLTIFLALVAGISLVVGGIGIMNIMLVAVTERTREIGLRKAVGAKRRDILFQFLIEAVALTLSGGIIGVSGGFIVGFVMARIAAKFLGNFTFTPSIGSVFLALAMAVGTGLVFGIYPARRASLLSPMEAMRYE